MDAGNERYRRLVESSPDGLVVTRDDRVVFSNRAGARFAGVADPADLIGRSVLDIFHPGSHARVQESLARARAGDAPRATDATIARADGGTTHVEIACAQIEDDDGAATRLVVRDVSRRMLAEAALRESEERLRLAFAGAQEGVWDWNLETGAVVYSPRWKQMLGYADDEIEPHLGAWQRLLHPEDKPRADELNESVMRGGQTYEGEFRLRHKAGHFIHVLSRGFPVRREPGGPVVRIVGTHFDLTERKRVEAERARAELLARLIFAQEDERRRIAREMHDQFGEHLTALGLGIGALKDACADRPELRGHVDALDGVARRLDRDVDHLVWALRPTALDDLGLRAALANYIQDWSARTGIRAELHTTGLLDHRLTTEVETTLYRIAQEALTNVAKHSRAQSVEVILERRADAVVLIVEDDGVGFEPVENPAAGRGFGLLGMQERAALVGAGLQIESAPGTGTTIFVRMTAAPASTPDNA